MKYWYLIITIPLLLSLVNINHWFYFRTVIKKYAEYIEGIFDKSTEKEQEKSIEAAEWLTGNLTEIKRRIEKAGIKIPTKNYMGRAGYGYVNKHQLNIIDNMLFKDSEILQQARHILETSKGYYLSQSKLSLNPLYWIEVIIYLPRWLMKESGIEVTSKMTGLVLNILQIIYWLILIAAYYYGIKL